MRRILTSREQADMLSALRFYAAAPEPDLWLTPQEAMQYAHQDVYHDITSLKDDIALNGITDPILIKTDGNYAYLENGHHRGRAALELGMDKVPVRVEWAWWAKNKDRKVGPGRLQDWLREHAPRLEGEFYEQYPQQRSRRTR